VWFFSATHGLERDNEKRWTGNIVDGKLRVRLIFLTARPLDESEATALTKLAAKNTLSVAATTPLRAESRQDCLRVHPCGQESQKTPAAIFFLSALCNVQGPGHVQSLLTPVLSRFAS